MRVLMIFMTCLLLSGCTHATLKSPCGPMASLSDQPCDHIPINFAFVINSNKNRS